MDSPGVLMQHDNPQTSLLADIPVSGLASVNFKSDSGKPDGDVLATAVKIIKEV